MRVKDLMTRPAASCSISDTLDRAAQLMWDRDCGAAPVVDQDGRLAGVITDRDICMAALFHDTPLNQIRIADVMTSDVRTCGPEDELGEAERVMSERQVHRLPVVGDDGTPIGMLSVSDVVRIVHHGGRTHRQAAADDRFLETLAAIRKPRPHAADGDLKA